MNRYDLSLGSKTSMMQRDVDQLIEKLVSFVLHARHFAINLNKMLLILLLWTKPLFGQIGFCYDSKNLRIK